MTLPTAAEITNLYLYGQKTTPNNLISDSLIRPNSIPAANLPSVNVNKQEFMTVGGGRFAVGRQFEIVNDFFTADSSKLPPNTVAKPYYTKVETAAIFGFGPNDFYGWNMQQYNFQDSKDDYAERAYIYNTQSFQIADDVRFVVKADGTRTIENFGIIPNKNVQENFDFNGGGLAKLVNPLIEPRIDPSHIGRAVNINFTGDVTRTTYDGNAYFNDLIKMNSWKGLDLIKLTTDVNQIINDLWASGVTKFLTADERPIIYGTDGNDNMDAANVQLEDLYPTLAPYAKNGVVLIGGKGDDSFRSSAHNDIFDAGIGNDTVQYGTGLLGFSGENIIISERSAISVLPDPNASTKTSQEIDLIVNIERIDTSSRSDNLDIVLLQNTSVQKINTGAGNDVVSVHGSALGSKPVIDLGAGNDILKAAPQGSIVYGGSGIDSFELGKDYLVADADTTDIMTYNSIALHGGVTWRGQESPWAKGLYGIKYAIDEVGELVIKTPGNGNDTYVAGFNNVLSGPATAGIRIGEMSLDAYRLFHTPNGANDNFVDLFFRSINIA